MGRGPYDAVRGVQMPMTHGVYEGILDPWVMDCMTGHTPMGHKQLQLSYYISCVGKQGKKYKCAVGDLPLYLLCWPR